MTRIVFMVAIALFSSSAMASKARMQALAQDENGSAYIEDTRMIFLNPALLARQGDFANFEMGSSTVPSTPNAEGGMFRELGAVKMGIQLGRESNAATRIGIIETAMGFALSEPHNTFEAIVAGGGDMKWGASLLYGSTENNAEIVPPATAAYPNDKASTLELRGGLSKDNWHGYAHLDLMSRSESETAAGATDKYEGKPSLRLGGAFNLA
ncbi:MAG TPA: hypothetical protein VFV50_16645, partial [Bdellovibrionales bacterium]|nr:hypothetical protein [Bdellovibrionales bacterium]